MLLVLRVTEWWNNFELICVLMYEYFDFEQQHHSQVPIPSQGFRNCVYID